MKKWAGALLVDKFGRVILQKRNINPRILNSGKISLFGGGVKKSETITEALKREIKEEIGIDLLEFEYFGLYRKRRAPHGDDCDCYVYLATNIDTTKIKVNEGLGFVLVAKDDGYFTSKYGLITKRILDDYFTSN